MRTLRPPNDERPILNMIGFSSAGPGSECSPFGNGTSPLVMTMITPGSSGGPPWSSSRNSGI